jgi:TonB family protein
VEILSDTEGVDFKPYMTKLRADVQEHWEPLIPKSARPPVRKSGHVTIQFALMKDGSVRGTQIVQSSGDVYLDRAAWGAIASSSFANLPAAYTKDSLVLRVTFSYNPRADDKNKTAAQQPDTKK